jgi:hypothetical protein
MGLTKMEMRAKRNVPKKRGYRSPRIYDRKQIMDEMIEWVENESSISFCEFCYSHGYLPRTIWTFQQESQDFEDVYTLVKMKLAERRERMVNNDAMHYGAFQRYQKFCDPFLSQAEDNEKDKDAARQKGVADQQNMNLIMLAKLASEGLIRQQD